MMLFFLSGLQHTGRYDKERQVERGGLLRGWRKGRMMMVVVV